jgi:hypothetical protein
MILLIGLAVLCYSMFLWASIMATDKMIDTKKWYLVLLIYIGAHAIALGEVVFFVIAVPIYL